MQPRRRPHHGNLPAARHRRKNPQCRIAGGLSARHQLPHLVHRTGADADSHSLPARPLHGDRRSRLQLADAGAAAPHQPDFSRADPVRTCGRATAHPHHQPDLGRGRRGGRQFRARQSARSRYRRRDDGELPLSDRLRRRALDRAQGDRRGTVRRRGRPARAVDLYPRARTDRPPAAANAPGAPAPSIRAAPAWCMRSTAASAGWCTIT